MANAVVVSSPYLVKIINWLSQMMENEELVTLKLFTVIYIYERNR